MWVIFALAVAGAYSVIWRTAPFHGTDTADYQDAARAIAAGADTPQPRTPGFPLFLLLTGTGRWFFLISIGLHLAGVAFLTAVLRSMDVSQRLRLIFAAVAILPPFIQKDAYLLTEGLTEFLLIAGFAGLWLAWESKYAAAWSGLALALAAITRPQNELLPLLLGALMVAYLGLRRAWRQAFALVLPSLVLVGGLTIHNQVKFGYAGLTYLLGHHLGTRTVTLYDKIPDPQVRDIMVSTRNDAYVHRNPYWTTWYTRQDLMRAKGLSPVPLARFMEKIHVHLILTHPLAYVEEVARAFCHFWSPDLPEQANRSAMVQLVSMGTQVLLCAAFWLAMVLWAGLSMGRLFLAIPEWLPGRKVQFLYAAALVSVLYTALLSTALDIGEPRYRGPVDLLILFVVVVTGHFIANARTLPAEK
jgi:hypothetical protein